jgi:YbbR domain-containing protein
MIKKERQRNIFYGILALFFSLVLFFIASGSSLHVNLSDSTEGYEEFLEAVPIQTNYDTDTYFIQGYETTVDVTLKSRNRIQLNAEKNEETRNFRVTADLTKLSEGTHEVTLEVQNLSSGVTAEIEPKTITVTIEKKATQTFAVEPIIADTNLEEGHSVASLVADPKKVEITTGDQTLKEIERVVAIVDPDDVGTTSTTVKGTIQALDLAGNPLAILSDPETVDVAVNLDAPTKEVELFVTQQGTVPSGISHYIYRMSAISGTISGNQSVLDTINQIGVPVDISNITSIVERTVEVPTRDGITVDPNIVTIQVTPVYESSETTVQNGNESTVQSSEVPTDSDASTEETARLDSEPSMASSDESTE